MDPKDRTIDKASQEVLEVVGKENGCTVWDRHDALQPQCGFGKLGICCRICSMGPCRIDPSGDGADRGVCGATADIIVARNLARMVAVGAAAHSDHGRDIAHALLLTAEGKTDAYKIKDEKKLNRLAEELKVKVDGRKKEEIAKDVAELLLAEFGKQSGELTFIQRAPEARKKIWRELDIVPRGIDREVVDLLHRTHIGGDNDAKNIILQIMRTALADGWGGSMIATELSDVLFGSPVPIRSEVNLGVLREDEVNILVHGHEPTLSDVIVAATQDKEIIKYANENGAKGVNLAGICCTSNEILMRHGIPIAGNFLQQELSIATGVVDVMLVDIQCVMPALGEFAKNYHTKVISTSPKAKFPDVEHINFNEEEALAIAKNIVKIAIDNFKNRDKERINIPKEKAQLVAGFTAENTATILGGRFRATYRPLNDAIISGRLRGAAAIVGCNNPVIKQDYGHVEMAKELLKNDVVIVSTGCSAIADAKVGLLDPEKALKYCGKGLKEICNTVGIPPVLHLGSCVDISRILMVLTNMVKEGGLGDDISNMPIAGAAPEWMSEKAISIGFYVIASGAFTVINPSLPILGSKEVTELVYDKIKELVGASFAFEADPVKGAGLMIKHMNEKRKLLKLKPMMYSKE